MTQDTKDLLKQLVEAILGVRLTLAQGESPCRGFAALQSDV